MPRRHAKKPTKDAKSAEDDSEVEEIDDSQEGHVSAPASSAKRAMAADDATDDPAASSTQGDDSEHAPVDESDAKSPPAKSNRQAKRKGATSAAAATKGGEENDEENAAQDDNESTPAPAIAQRRSARAHNPAPVYTSPSVASSKRDAESSPVVPASQTKAPSGRPPRPTKRTLSVQAGKPKKDAPKPVKPSGDEGSDDESEFMLYEAVKSGSSSTATLVREWRSRFEADATAASRELINFIMNACGSTSICVEEHDDLDELDLMLFVDTVVVSLQASEQQMYPLASKAKGFRKFKDSFESFWKVFIDECWDSELIHTTDIVEKTVDWLNSLSSSEVRAIRHTSTFAAYAIGNALVARAKQLTDLLGPINRQCAAADTDGKKTPKSKANPKLARLLELKGTYDEQLANTMTYLTSLFNGVIVHRYRDTMPELRIESAQTLGLWIDTLPGEFLVDNYLKFLGWMLNDKSSKVRLAVVDALQTLYSHEEHAEKLALFTSRFLRRYLEMCDDVDDDVVLSIVELIANIDRLNLLDGESDLSVVERLVFDPDTRIRRSAAEFVCLQYDAFGVSDQDMTEAQLIVQAVALVEFAEEYMGGGGNEADDALDSIDLLVTAFWDNPDSQVLANWRLQAVLLGSDTHEPSLSSHQQTILLRLLIGAVKQIVATGQGGAKKPRKRGDDAEPMTIFFCREIPTLMLRFQSEPAKLCLLLQLVSTLDWNDTSIMNQHKKHVEDLLGRLKHAYTTHSDERFLKELSRCIHHMTESANTALTRQASVLEQELMRDAIEQCQALLAQGKASKDTEFGLQAWLARLHFLSGYINLNDVETVDIPAVLLAFVHDRTALADLAAGPRLASSCVQYAAQILFKEFLWSSAPLFEAIDDAASADEATTAAAMDALVHRRDNLEAMLFRLLAVHLSDAVTASTPSDQVLDMPELELTDDQISYVNCAHKTAFLLLSDLRCLCAQRFEDAIAPFNRLAYRPHKNLLMLSQSYYERVMEDDDDEAETKESLLVALACTSLCNPQNKRQAAAVLQQMTSESFQPLVKAFGKRMMGVSVVKYLEIQMLSLQQAFEESGAATVELAKVLNQSLGTKLPATVRGSFLKFMSEGLRYGLDAVENGAFFAVLKPFVGRLDKAGLKTLHGHFTKFRAAKPDIDDDQLDPAVADVEAFLSGEKDAVAAPPKPAAATLKRVRDNLSDDEDKPAPRRSRNLSDEEDDDAAGSATPPPQSFGRHPSPNARKPRAKRASQASADRTPKKKRTPAKPSQASDDDGEEQEAPATPAAKSQKRTKTPPSKASTAKRTPQRRSTRTKVVVELDSDEEDDDDDVEVDAADNEATPAGRKRSKPSSDEDSTPASRGTGSQKDRPAADVQDDDETKSEQDDDDDEVVGFRPKRRRR